MAARSIWSGALGFGLVNVPCKLYSATSDRGLSFKQINSKTGAKVKQKRIDSLTGDEVDYGEIVKGYELTSDKFVVIQPEELEALAPKKTKMIELETFVNLSEIDPLIYGDSYYVSPDTGAAKPYRLLVRAMGDAEMVGIGRVILRTKERLVAVRPRDGMLVCSTLCWPDEVNATDGLVKEEGSDPTDRELKMASALIASMETSFDHGSFRDEYRDHVLRLIESKASGGGVQVIDQAQDDEPAAPDLMSALEASLASADGQKSKKRVPAKSKKAVKA